MASGGGYDGAITPVTGPLTIRQRQRLEALTFARKLCEASRTRIETTVPDWVYLAKYIDQGEG